MPLKTTQFIVIGALVVVLLTASGLAIHYRARSAEYQQKYVEALVRIDESSASPRAAARPAAVRAMERQPVEQERVDELQDRLRELEEELEYRDRIIADMRRRNVQLDMPLDEDRPERVERDWMADLQERDPERYEEIMERREQARQRVQDAFARQAAHFLYRDMEAMSETEQQEYSRMLGLLAETWQLSEQLQSDELAREQRGELRRELMQNIRALRPMLEDERDREFYEMGLQLGYDERAAADFVNYINEMIEITTFSGMWGGGTGRGRGAPDR